MVYLKARKLLVVGSLVLAGLSGQAWSAERCVGVLVGEAIASLAEHDSSIYPRLLLRLNGLASPLSVEGLKDNEGAPGDSVIVARLQGPEEAPPYPLLYRMPSTSGVERWAASSPRDLVRPRFDEWFGFLKESAPEEIVARTTSFAALPLAQFAKADLSEFQNVSLAADEDEVSPLRRSSWWSRSLGIACAIPAGTVVAAGTMALSVGCALMLPPILRGPASWFAAFATAVGGLVVGHATFEAVNAAAGKRIELASTSQAFLPVLIRLLSAPPETLEKSVYYLSFGSSPRIDMLLDGANRQFWIHQWLPDGR